MNERRINWMKRADRYGGIPLVQVLRGFRGLFAPWPAETPQGDPSVKRVVLMKLWGIGNLVMILPLVHAVRRAHPKAELAFVTLAGNVELLRHVPEIDRLITVDPRGFLGTMRRLVGVARELRAFRPDLVLDFEQFLKVTPLLAGISGAVQTVGFETQGQARASLFNKRVPYRRDRHMTLAFGDIVRSAGVSTQGMPPLAVPRSEEGAREARAFLDEPSGAFDEPAGSSTSSGVPGPLVALHLGSGDNFPGRRWPVKRFARLAEALHAERRARIVITGTEAERDLAARFADLCPAPHLSAMGALSLMGFIEFLDRVDLLVTNDTAPAHIGSALGVPLIAFYGPNTPDLYGPLHEACRVFYHRLPCSPCLTNLNAKTSACRVPSCILAIEPETVLAAAKDLLDADTPADDDAEMDLTDREDAS